MGLILKKREYLIEIVQIPPPKETPISLCANSITNRIRNGVFIKINTRSIGVIFNVVH